MLVNVLIYVFIDIDGLIYIILTSVVNDTTGVR